MSRFRFNVKIQLDSTPKFRFNINLKIDPDSNLKIHNERSIRRGRFSVDLFALEVILTACLSAGLHRVHTKYIQTIKKKTSNPLETEKLPARTTQSHFFPHQFLDLNLKIDFESKKNATYACDLIPPGTARFTD